MVGRALWQQALPPAVEAQPVLDAAGPDAGERPNPEVVAPVVEVAASG